MVQLARAAASVIGPKSRRIDLVDATAHAVFPERQVGFEAFQCPSSGNQKSRTALGSWTVMSTLTGDRCGDTRKKKA
jgi:hypothetical protein